MKSRDVPGSQGLPAAPRGAGGQAIARLHLDDVLAVAAILFATLALYLADLPSDLFGDDDFVHTLRAARLYEAFLGLFGPGSDAMERLHGLGMFGALAGFARHGFVHDLYMAAAFGIYDLFSVPVSRLTLQLPIALLAALSVALTYLFLRRAELPIMAAVLGVLLLGFSPVFVAAARGLATLWVVGIVFNYSLLLLAFERIDRSRYGPAVAAAATIMVLWTDQLSYLTLAAVLAAYLAAGVKAPAGFDLRFLRAASVQLGERLRVLARPSFLVPVLAAMLVLVAAAVLAIWLGEAAGQRLTVPPLEPFLNRITMLSAPVSEGGGVFAEKLELAFGVVGPWIILPLLAGVTVAVRPGWRMATKSGRLLLAFAILAAVGYGLLFYGLVRRGGPVAEIFQLYAIYPATLLVPVLVVQTARLTGQVQANAILAVMVATTMGSAGQFVWKVPVPWQGAALQTLDTWGVSYPPHGTKAAGFLVRRALSVAYRAVPRAQVRVEFSVPRQHQTSAFFYAGLVQDGAWYRRVAEAQTVPEVEIRPVNACTVRLCVWISGLAVADQEAKAFIVKSNGKVIARVEIGEGADAVVEPLEAAELERRYDETYTALWDTYNPATREDRIARVHAILRSLERFFPNLGTSVLEG